MVSNQLGKTDEARNAVVHSQVHLGKPEGEDGFGLEVEIQVEGVSQELIDAGHAVSIAAYMRNEAFGTRGSYVLGGQACPYSRAMKHGAVVKVSKKD